MTQSPSRKPGKEQPYREEHVPTFEGQRFPFARSHGSGPWYATPGTGCYAIVGNSLNKLFTY